MNEQDQGEVESTNERDRWIRFPARVQEVCADPDNPSKHLPNADPDQVIAIGRALQAAGFSCPYVYFDPEEQVMLEWPDSGLSFSIHTMPPKPW